MFNIPIISDFFGFNNVYPMKLYEKGKSSEALPCDIMNYALNQGWDIPTEPIETSEFIGDTQFRQPKNLSLVVFVLNEKVDEFERRIKEIQGQKNGFEFIDRDSNLYTDFWLTDYQKQSEVNNGYLFNLSLQELILVEAFSSAVSYQQTNNPGLSGKTNNGEQTNNAKKGGNSTNRGGGNGNNERQSTLYGIFN